MAESNGLVVLNAAQIEEMIDRAVQKAFDRGPIDRSSQEAEILTRTEVAELLRIHPNYVASYVKKHGLPGHKMGSEWRFLRSEVLAWHIARSKAA